MITRECRPKTFDELAGQDQNKKVLKSIIKTPEKSPKVIIMQGAYGTGKTSSARLFARALNCTSSSKPCGKCKNCTEDIDHSSFYSEYDSAVVGNVDRIRELRDTFSYTVSDGYKVIVFDEVHLVSKTAQSALLKVLEESPERVFFILCTTDVDKVLPTIRSRALELRYEAVSREAVVKNLRGICDLKGIDITDEVLDIIARKSRGHMRNAHMYLDQYLLIGSSEFKNILKTSADAIEMYFYYLAKRDVPNLFKSIDDIMTYPLADVVVDFQEEVLELTKVLVNCSSNSATKYNKEIVSILGADVLKLTKLCISDWVVSSFYSDVTLQSALLCIYQMMEKVGNTQTNSSEQTPLNRMMRR